jgi:hypothetical protein
MDGRQNRQLHARRVLDAVAEGANVNTPPDKSSRAIYLAEAVERGQAILLERVATLKDCEEGHAPTDDESLIADALRAFALSHVAAIPMLAVDTPRTNALMDVTSPIGFKGQEMVNLARQLERELADMARIAFSSDPEEIAAARSSTRGIEALLAALRNVASYSGHGPHTTPWQSIVRGLGEQAREALKAYEAAPASAIEATLTEGERVTLGNLIHLVRALYYALDDGEETERQGVEIAEDHYNLLSLAIAVFDDLPDDKPGYVMGPAAKAAWALRRIIGESEAATDGRADAKEKP